MSGRLFLLILLNCMENLQMRAAANSHFYSGLTLYPFSGPRCEELRCRTQSSYCFCSAATERFQSSDLIQAANEGGGVTAGSRQITEDRSQGHGRWNISQIHWILFTCPAGGRANRNRLEKNNNNNNNKLADDRTIFCLSNLKLASQIPSHPTSGASW